MLEILPYIDFEKIKQNPKWIQGYSDTTGLSFCVTTICDVATIYGDNFGSFGMRPWHKCLNDSLELLEGKKLEYENYDKYESEWREEITGLEPINPTVNVEWKNGKAEEKIVIEGRLIGGCIDVLHSLVGTRFDKVKEFCEKYKKDGMIWFFDNYDLSSEEILRTLWQFKEAGWFKNCKGIIIGRPFTRKTCAEISFEESVMTAVEELNIPIVFDADIGHVAPQIPLINGAKVHIENIHGKGKISFTLV